MAENIELAKFEFNIDGVVKSAQELKTTILALKKDQQILKKAGLENSVAFVQNEADLKLLNAEYGKHIKVINEDTKAVTDATNRTELLNLALSQEATSIKDVREQNKLLNKLRNETNVTTKEGQEQIKQLNAKLDSNNELVKTNADQYLAQKLNIGNYKSALDGLSPTLGGMVTKLQGVYKGLLVVKEGMVASAGATTGTAKALKIFRIALISTGIGAIVVALGAMVTLFAKTREGTDALTRTITPLKEIFNSFLGLLEQGGKIIVDAFSKPQETIKKLGDIIKQNLINRVEGIISIFGRVGEAIKSALTLDFDGVSKAVEGIGEDVSKTITGVEDFAGKLKKVGQDASDYFGEAYDRGKEIADLGIQIEKDEIALIEKRAESLRIIRQQELIAKDKARTDAERKIALDKALALTKEIELAELDVLTAKIKQKELQQEANDTDRDEFRALAELKAKRDENQDKTIKTELRFLGIKNQLAKASETRAKKAQDDAIKRQKEELNLLIAGQGFKAKSLQEELDLSRKVSAEKIAILDAELKAKKISQTQYDTEVLNLKTDLAGQEAEIAVSSAELELQIYRENLARRREDAGFLSEELANIRKEENEELLEETKSFQTILLNQGKINQQEFDDAIRLQKEETRIANKEIDDEREAVEKEEAIELRALEFEQELALMTEENATTQELEQAQLDEKYAVDKAKLDQSLADGLISEELYNARKVKLDNDLAKSEIDIKKKVDAQKLALTGGLLSQLSGLIDKNSAAGKAIAVAQAGINTFQGITEGLKAPFPLNIAMPILAGVTGALATKNILSTKVPSATGSGSVGGGGSAPQGLGSEISSSISGQGVNLSTVASSGNSAVQGQVENQANQDGLADNVAEAVERGAEAGTMAGSEQGLTNVSDNVNMAEMSKI